MGVLAAQPHSKGLLLSEDYKRLMMVRDPTSTKFSQPINLLNAYGAPSLHHEPSKSSGFKPNVFQQAGASSSKRTLNIAKFTKDKRPVSSYSMLRRQAQAATQQVKGATAVSKTQRNNVQKHMSERESYN